MTKKFEFHTLLGSARSTEANIFIHGFSAGHTPADREKLVKSIPESLNHYTNIFAFWPSGHYSQLNSNSRRWIKSTGSLPVSAMVLAVDRTMYFVAMRSRAEAMGKILPFQLTKYLHDHHPEIDTINFIGHSLGGRLIVSSLKTFASQPNFGPSINDVLLMAAAVNVKPPEAKEMRSTLKGRLINAYSRGDWALMMNVDETCLGRNEVEHFENIEIAKFGHTDYWKKLPEVFKRTQFKSPPEISSPCNDTSTAPAKNHPSTPSFNEPQHDKHILTLVLNTPAEIYLRLNEEIHNILGSLTGTSTDATLNQAKKEAYELLSQRQATLQSQLNELEKYAEWKTFTIAFYGETGAGKSTIIETLRILLQEPGKIASQLKFRELKRRYSSSEKNAQQLQQTIDQFEIQLTAIQDELNAVSKHHDQLHSDALKNINITDAHLDKVVQQLNATFQEQERQHNNALNAIAHIEALITDYKKTASIWQKLLGLFRATPEEIQLSAAKQQLPVVAIARDNAGITLRTKQKEIEQNKIANKQQLLELEVARDKACKLLLTQKAAAEKNRITLCQQQQQYESDLRQLLRLLEQQADGEIIGDGRPDFTRQTQRYDLVLDGHPFALLDVPGIEGNEGLVHEQIAQAVKTAHAVFYVTNQAAPPQTGDEQHKGTLEKIKAHLGSQTEVWTIFNKKITNPKFALTGRPLTSEDENRSLSELDKKMQEQLGEHYREVFPLTALSAFLASTDHFAPNSVNFDRRNKIIDTFHPDELLEKSRLRAFLELLSKQLLKDSKKKINRANFHKANEAVSQAASTIEQIHRTLLKLSENLDLEGQSTKVQLSSSFSTLKTRLDATRERQVDTFTSNVRNAMYGLIDKDISNDHFKNAFKDSIDTQIERLGKQIPDAITKDFVYFQRDAEEILKRFEIHAGELTATYIKLASVKMDDKFDLKLNLQNGLKVSNLLVALASGAMLAWNPGGWLLIALSVSGLVLGAYKAVKNFFSSDFKKAQQRKAVEDNLNSVVEQLRITLHDSLKKSLPELQEKIDQLELALEAPAKQTITLVKLLMQSVSQLKLLSRQISSLEIMK